MSENRIKISKEDVVELLRKQLIKINGTYEKAIRIKLEDGRLVMSTTLVSILEGVILITDLHKDKDTHLLIKLWDKEEDIPNDFIWKDNSSKVSNLLLGIDNSEFYIQYKNYSGMTFIVEETTGAKDKEGCIMETYEFTLEKGLV